jgi:hypothetical protein
MIDDLISQWANEIIVHQIIDSFVRKIGQTHIPTLIVGVTLFAIELADRSVIVSIAGAKTPVCRILDRTGASEQIGSDRLYPSVAAVENLGQM